MNLFLLKIFTPNGIVFESNVCQVSVRSIDGDVSILAGHAPYITFIDSGKCKIFENDNSSPIIYDCKNGFLIVKKNIVEINLEYCVLNSK